MFKVWGTYASLDHLFFIKTHIQFLYFFYQTIELQDKKNKIYCVACEEIDTDIQKDNPGIPPSHLQWQ